MKKIISSALIPVFVLSLIVSASPVQAAPGKSNHAAVCAKGNDEVRCHAHVEVDAEGNAKAFVAPSGLGPAAFHAAYTPVTTVSEKRIIAIVDAYDHPNIKADLDTYSTTYGIPKLPSCVGPIASSATPCFQKMSQSGSTTKFPVANAGWALEIALDVETAHAMCQNCGILLVEATSASYNDLMASVDRAVLSGANVVSNSYGSNEFPTQTNYDFHFNRPGVAFTVSSGDAGYGAQYPASSPYVTAVGGTTLNMSGTTYVSETAWAGAGSGCSAYEAKPSFQHDTECANRTVADVSAVADPNTGAAVYNSFRTVGKKKGSWYVVGGTSLSAPLIAGMYALGGVPSGVQANSLPYGTPSALRDILSGSNGSCSGSYLCTALAGYDGPTGLGSPNGLGAF
ncbi:MAG: S53 family peptidase [Patescibacteria group bacterium]